MLKCNKKHKYLKKAAKNNLAICCNVLQGGETITLQVYDSANKIWGNAQANGQLFQITAQTNFMSIYEDTQIYRIVKSATSVPVGVDITFDIPVNYLPKLIEL